MKINFFPEYDNTQLEEAVNEYNEIWLEYGKSIIEVIEKIADLRFIEKEINALVFEGRSYSHPLQLRASYTVLNKKNALVHELCHRICYGNKVKILDENEPKIVAAHKVVFLILYDILEELFGKEIADNNVVNESSYSVEYQKAWEWALSNSENNRREIFNKLKYRGSN